MKKIFISILINIIIFSFLINSVYAFNLLDWLKSIFGLEATTYYCYNDLDCCSGNTGQYVDCRGSQQSGGSIIYSCYYRSSYLDGYTYCSGGSSTTKPPTTTTYNSGSSTKLCVKDGVEYAYGYMYCDGNTRVICIKNSECPVGTTCSGGWSYYPCPSGNICYKDTTTGGVGCKPISTTTTTKPITTTTTSGNKNCDSVYGDKRLIANNGQAVCTQVNQNILQCYVCVDGVFKSDFNQLKCNGAQICYGEVVLNELYKAYDNCQLAFDKACKFTTSTTVQYCGIDNPCPSGMKCYLGSCIKFDTPNCAFSDCRCTSDYDCANGYVCYPNKCDNGILGGEMMCVDKSFKDLCEEQRKKMLDNPTNFIIESIKLETMKIFASVSKYLVYVLIILGIFLLLWLLT